MQSGIHERAQSSQTAGRAAALSHLKQICHSNERERTNDDVRTTQLLVANEKSRDQGADSDNRKKQTPDNEDK